MQMKNLAREVREAWENRDGAVVLGTVNESGTPNIIYATCVGLYKDGRIVVADNYFEKTRKNIQAGSKGSILFITKEKKAYQVKGSIEYHTEGKIFDFMKSWNPEEHPGHAAASLVPEAVFSGSKKIC
jgi:predicted pyridoxine 5'-phosphate oxidase superfamily flavin-nucleotide-binding protein